MLNEIKVKVKAIIEARRETKKLPLQKKKDIKAKNKNIIRKVLLGFVIMSLVIMLVGSITVFNMIRKAPELDPDKLILAQSPEIYDRNEELITTLHSVENRRSASIDEIPKILKDAVVSMEDVRFYTHNGIDFRRIAGAIIANIKNGFGSQGASTITQQVVKNLFLTGEKPGPAKFKNNI